MNNAIEKQLDNFLRKAKVNIIEINNALMQISEICPLDYVCNEYKEMFGNSFYVKSGSDEEKIEQVFMKISTLNKYSNGKLYLELEKSFDELIQNTFNINANCIFYDGEHLHIVENYNKIDSYFYILQSLKINEKLLNEKRREVNNYFIHQLEKSEYAYSYYGGIFLLILYQDLICKSCDYSILNDYGKLLKDKCFEFGRENKIEEILGLKRRNVDNLSQFNYNVQKIIDSFQNKEQTDTPLYKDKNEKIIALLNKIAKEYDIQILNSISKYLYKGYTRFSLESDLKDSLVIMNKAIEMSSNNYTLFLNRAMIYMKFCDIKNAINDIKNALQSFDGNVTNLEFFEGYQKINIDENIVVKFLKNIISYNESGEAYYLNGEFIHRFILKTGIKEIDEKSIEIRPLKWLFSDEQSVVKYMVQCFEKSYKMDGNIESLKRIIEIKIEEDNFDDARKLCEETLDRIENEEIKQLLDYIVEYKHVDGFIGTNLQTLKQKFKGNFYKYKESKIDKEYRNMVETEYLADIALGSNDNDNYHDVDDLEYWCGD